MAGSLWRALPTPQGALSYALRSDERGKPRRAASEPMVAITAEVLVRSVSTTLIQAESAFRLGCLA
jgi:hypothetical protein